MYSILVVAPAWVGDSVMAEPLYQLLSKKHRDLVLDVLAPGWTLPLLQRMPQVRNAIENPFAHGQLRLQERRALGVSLRPHRYDQAIVLPNSLKSALIPWFANIPKRTGFVGEMRYGLLNDARKLEPDALPLMVERFAFLAGDKGDVLRRPVPNPRMVVDSAQAKATLASLGLSLAKPVVAFCPGAEYGEAKRWPARHFAELARNIGESGGQVWIFGSGKDREIGDAISLAAGADDVHQLAGKTTLDQAVDLLSFATVVVTNDSGLMHVAAALDRPIIALFGSSSPGFTPPLSQKAQILSLNLPCSPCFKRVCPLGHLDCLNKLSPQQVYQAVLAVLH
ncbi:MAG: lipopolysaccharide heptosyltransferase II [Neisseriaceae bacterium]|jgi:heptosyltransferase-2|nr:MAG: lipopolysaccharide heptosyltransferase II [Neisseriaceae bacterium]